MPFIPDPPFPKTRGQTLRSKDWNDIVAEVQRLDTAKVNKIGDSMSGPLSISGALSVSLPTSTTPTAALSIDVASFATTANATASYLLRARDVSTTEPALYLRGDGRLGLGTDSPADQLHVTTSGTFGPFGMGVTPGRLMVTGSTAEIGFARRNLAAWPATPVAGDRYVWYNSQGTAALWTEAAGDLLRVSPSGELTMRNSAGALQPTFTGEALGNEGSFKANNLKLQMGITGGLIFTGPGLPAPPPFVYEFTIGHRVRPAIIIGGGITTFFKAFSVDQAGNVSIAGALNAGGSKGGYVVDTFINMVGDSIEQGDVVVIGPQNTPRYYGVDNSIPIPEVDLTTQAYDRRVCGIVDRVVTEDGLPYVETRYPSQADLDAGTATMPTTVENPYKPLSAASDAADHSVVGPQQMGKMVTLGAYAFCKVDADLAAIEPGDLLTTSPTKGHAQKVIHSEQAIGAVIGKALAGLAAGKGKIPVMVLFQ